MFRRRFRSGSEDAFSGSSYGWLEDGSQIVHVELQRAGIERAKQIHIVKLILVVSQRQPHGPEAGRTGDIEVLVVVAFPRPANSPLIEGNVVHRAVACGQNLRTQFPLTVATELNCSVAELTQLQNFEHAAK